MKQLKLLAILILALSLIVGSLTSCEYLEELGIVTTDPTEPSDESNEPTDDPTDETPDDPTVDPLTCGHYVTTTENVKAATCSENGYTGDVVCYACKTVIKAGKATDKTDHNYVDGVCTSCGAEDSNSGVIDSVIADWQSRYECITIAEALALCESFVSSPSSDRYYIIGTVVSVDDNMYGKLVIEDETGSIMVYGTYNHDGSIRYDAMGDPPVAGDLILIHGTLQHYNGTTKEVQNARLIDCYAGAVVPPVIDIPAPGSTITIEKATEIAGLVGANDRYYISAKVTSILNSAYGQMKIEDETGTISVYNSASADGSIGYADMTDKPYKGDTVLLYCTLQNFNGTKEVKSAWIIEFTHNEPDINPDDYSLISIADARLANDGDIVKVQGVVARITYATGYKPSGFILIDGTQSIYVYDGDVAARVKIGNTVTVVGAKDHWILDTEIYNAEKFGYTGCNQLTDVYLVSNDEGNTAFDTSWMTETTVKDIMDTPVSEDITTVVFKVTALIKRADGNGFINYYIDDLDGITGSYVYTQCNGGDFDWLDEFDGKICTVYLTALNAKSSSSGCAWRFLPIAVIDEGYTFDVNNAPEFAVKYHGIPQFLESYTGDPAIELVTSVSSELLVFENVILSYTSDNEAVVYFTTADGVTVFHCGKAGTATVTVTATHNGNTASKTITITVSENATVEYITVADAIATPKDTDVTVKGIVGPSLVNQDGFYLFGEDGSMIAVKVSDKSIFGTIAIGNEIIITGMRERYIKDDSYTTYGQDAIVGAVVIANYYGSHEYSTEKFITGKTLADITKLDVTESHSTEVYIVKANVEVVETAYYTNIKITYDGVELTLYCSGAKQYSWLTAYAGKEVTMEVAPCNWNEKTSYRGCVLAVYNEDGTKTLNTLNFN